MPSPNIHRHFHKNVKPKLTTRFLIGIGILAPVALPVVMMSAQRPVGLAVPAQAQGTHPADVTQAQINAAISVCIDEILKRQFTDAQVYGEHFGAIRVSNNGRVGIENYFALQACLALLARSNSPASREAVAVKNYLVWYANHIDPQEGVAHNYSDVGRVAGDFTQENPGYDSIDSYAGLYLLVCARYQKSGGTLPDEAKTAASISLRALNDVINHKPKVHADFLARYQVASPSPFHPYPAAQTNQLSMDRGGHCQHYLANNVEAFAGLHEAPAMFTAIGKTDDADMARTLAKGIAEQSKRFVLPQLFAPLIGDNDVVDTTDADTKTRSTGVYADLYGISYLTNGPSTLWSEINQAYGPNSPTATEFEADDANPANPQTPAELWLIAANHVAPNDVGFWQGRVVDNVTTVNRFKNASGNYNDTYIGRLAITVLALSGSSAGLPQVIADPTPTPTPSPSPSPTPTATATPAPLPALISGTVVSREPDAQYQPKDVPLQKAHIVLLLGKTRVNETSTDGAGHFTFGSVTPGTYTVTVDSIFKEGESTLTRLPFTLSQTIKITKRTLAAPASFTLLSVWGQVVVKGNKNTPSTAQSGAKVDLYKAGSLLGSDVADANGFYSFRYLGRAKYQIKVTPSTVGVTFPKGGNSVTLPGTKAPEKPSLRFNPSGTLGTKVAASPSVHSS